MGPVTARSAALALGLAGVLHTGVGCASLPGPATAPRPLGALREATEIVTDARGVARFDVVIDEAANGAERVELEGPIEAVPERVRAAAASAVGGPSPTSARWVIDDAGLAFYRLDGTDAAGHPCHIAVDAVADLLETECALAAEELLPPPVQATADRLAPGPRGYAAVRRTSADESFVVHVQLTDRVQILEIAGDGTLLEHRVRFEGSVELPYLGAPALAGTSR